MATYTWPSSLPQEPIRDGFEDAVAMRIESTPMDMGPPKTRRRGANQVPVPVVFILTDAQVDTLQSFIEDDLLGVRRFNFPHPRTRSTVEVVLVADGTGRLMQMDRTGSYWRVGLSLLVMP